MANGLGFNVGVVTLPEFSFFTLSNFSSMLNQPPLSSPESTWDLLRDPYSIPSACTVWLRGVGTGGGLFHCHRPDPLHHSHPPRLTPLLQARDSLRDQIVSLVLGTDMKQHFGTCGVDGAMQGPI